MNIADKIARPPRLLPLALAIALAAAASGCQPNGKDMGTLTAPMPQAPPTMTVHEPQRHLAVNLYDGAVGPSEWRRIDSFLAGAAPDRSDTVHLVVAGDAPPRVIALVVHHALAFGYLDHKIAVVPGGMAGSHATLRLTTRVAVPVLPNCPQTAHLNIIDGENRVGSDWGCSTVSMMELQVADPHDLVRGEAGGETDSVLTTAAIHRLQTDKVKKLENTSSTSSVQSGGGAQ
jgi:type IV pilus biogenesis protein CpaD/CtpE